MDVWCAQVLAEVEAEAAGRALTKAPRVLSGEVKAGVVSILLCVRSERVGCMGLGPLEPLLAVNSFSSILSPLSAWVIG